MNEYADRITEFASGLQMRKAAANVAKMSVALPFYVLGFIVGLIVRLFRLSAGGFMLGIQDASGIEIRLNRESNE